MAYINITPAKNLRVRCDEDCGTVINIPVGVTTLNRVDKGQTNKALSNRNWQVTNRGKHICPSCTAENEQPEQEVDMTARHKQRLANGKTATGIEVFLNTEPVYFPLMAAEMGAHALADEIGVAVSTASRLAAIKRTSPGQSGFKKVYEVAAEALALRAEMKTKNEMLDRAQCRANMAEQEATKTKVRLEEAEHRLQQADRTIDDLRKEQADPFDDEAEDKRWAYVQGAMDAHDGVVTVEQLRATIKAFFNRDVFDLTPDDLALMNMTLRDVVKGG